MTREDFHLTRKFEESLRLESLLNGAKHSELRFWSLASSYDPQIVFVVSQSNSKTWLVRRILFNHAKNDSIETDHSRTISSQIVDSLNLQLLWSLNSQSDLKNGDSYSCFDGEDLFLEIVDSTKYRCMWYRCVENNKYKDSVFLLADELWSKLDGLNIQNRRR